MSLVTPEFHTLTRDFSVGFLDSPQSDTLPLGATIDARNAFLVATMEARDSHPTIGVRGVRAVVRKRLGARMVNPVAMASQRMVGELTWYRPEAGQAQLLAVCNGFLWVFDNIDTFTSLGAAVFVVDGLVQSVDFKDNVWFTDGVTQKRYNGTALLDIGFLKPTGPPTLAIVTGGALPLTATYESFAVWYDSKMDHESSPSLVSGALTTSAGNLMRRHGKPPGAPPVNVDFWRVYVRRVDTTELNYYLTVTVPIATVTIDETISDAARRVAGPKENVNDPPPVFAFITVFKDFGIAVKANESYFYVSKAGDLESWDPNDKFALERGSGKSIRSATLWVSDILIQKPGKTWRLIGDKPPFQALVVHSEFGNVGPRSAIEVERMLYAWDEQRGPYRTDLVDWETLATNRIETFLTNLNRDELQNIQVEHDPENMLIIWAIPASTRAQPRRRHLLAYNYRLNCWLPPITGLEYGCLARFQPLGGKLGLYVGDYWGRVYRLFDGPREGVPENEQVTAQVYTGTPTTVVAQPGTNFYTVGNGLAGLLVLVESPSGAFQWRRIQSNTADTITLDTVHDAPWQTIPNSDRWTIHLGAVEFYWTTPWHDGGRPDLLKRGGFLFVEGKSAASGPVLVVQARFNQNLGVIYEYDFTFPAQGSTWGVDVWGQAYWGVRQRLMNKRRINRAFYSMQVRFESFFADLPVDLTAYGIEADSRPRKRGRT